MADFPLIGSRPYALESGLDLANVTGTTITANGSADTKGSWVELESAAGNTFSTGFLYVMTSDRGGTNNTYLIDIGIGGASSEQVIINNLYSHTTSVTTSSGSSNLYMFPISIPSGTRISARLQSSTGGAALDLLIIRAPSSFIDSSSCSKVIAIGDDAANSAGTTVARSSAGVFGSWVEITASLSNNIKGFSITGIQSTVTSWQGSAELTYQVGVGGSGNEEVIFSGWLISQGNSETTQGVTAPFVPVGIAAGERISIRAAGSVSNTDLDLEYIIYGAV